jgi:hypothetical protein
MKNTKILLFLLSSSLLTIYSCSPKLAKKSSGNYTQSKPVGAATTLDSNQTTFISGGREVNRDIAEGRLLASKKCTSCHKNYSPKNYSAATWNTIFNNDNHKNTGINSIDFEKIKSFILDAAKN